MSEFFIVEKSRFGHAYPNCTEVITADSFESAITLYCSVFNERKIREMADHEYIYTITNENGESGQFGLRVKGIEAILKLNGKTDLGFVPIQEPVLEAWCRV